jgi:hypothetical protein
LNKEFGEEEVTATNFDEARLRKLQVFMLRHREKNYNKFRRDTEKMLKNKWRYTSTPICALIAFYTIALSLLPRLAPSVCDSLSGYG